MNVRPREPNCWAMRRAAPIADEVDFGALFGFVMGGLEDICDVGLGVGELLRLSYSSGAFAYTWPHHGRSFRNHFTILYIFNMFDLSFQNPFIVVICTVQEVLVKEAAFILSKAMLKTDNLPRPVF
jgi:hypothetical protein